MLEHQRVGARPADLDGQLRAAAVDRRHGLLPRRRLAQHPDAGLGLDDLDVQLDAVDARLRPLGELDDPLPAVELDREPRGQSYPSMNDFRRFEREGWRSLRSALASI